jgi:hypothetical protein
MGHPSLPTPETRGRRVWATIHPSADKPTKSRKKREKGIQEVLIEVVTEAILKGIAQWTNQNRSIELPQAAIGQIPNIQREAKKPPTKGK